MKVICIDNGGLFGKECRHAKILIVGNEYTVVEVKNNGGYILAETYDYQYRLRNGFYPERFIPLSDIDEKEFERNYNKQLEKPIKYTL